MTRHAFTAILLASAVCLGLGIPCAKADSGLYLALSGGAIFADDASSSISTNTAFDTGFRGNAAVGGAISDFRLEAELSVQQADIDVLSSGTVTSDGSGDLSIGALMANAYVDIDIGTRLFPYIGAGVGGAAVVLSDVAGTDFAAIDDDVVVFAYQAMVGGGFALSDSVTLTAGYRYFATDDAEVTDNATTPITTDGFQVHTVEGGLRFTF